MSPSETADMKVPAKAKVRMLPMCLKKLPYAVSATGVDTAGILAYLVQFVTSRKNDGWKQEVEEHLIVETDCIQDRSHCCQSQYEANDHT
jgi:hypothetical protein